MQDAVLTERGRRTVCRVFVNQCLGLLLPEIVACPFANQPNPSTPPRSRLNVVSSHTGTASAGGVVHAAIDLRRFPWIRPLVSEYTHQFQSIAPLFAGNPADPQSWREAIDRVQRAPRRGADLSRLIDAQLARRSAPPEARQAARQLTDSATVAVVTGQQAGLFGGPLYTLLKAVTAVQLAERVRSEHGTPAVAIFWVDAEDHDWEEVRSAKVLDADLAVRQVSLDSVEGAGARPIASLALDSRVDGTLDALERTLAQTEFTSDLLRSLRRHYRAGHTMATSFAAWLDELLGRHGLIVFEAADPALKPLAADIFARELENPCRTATLAREAGDLMRTLGHAPQVEPVEDGVALFYLDGDGRRSIRRRGGDFVIGETTRPAAELKGEVQRHPERFSPNVLLRPLVQDRIFPTVCYVCGPSELAYQAQLGGVYREFGVEVPLLYPRVNATLLDSGAVRFLERYGVALEALHAQDESVLNRLLESQLPPGIEAGLGETEREISERAASLKRIVTPLDPTLVGAVDTTIDRIRETLHTLHTKIIQATKRKDDTLRRQFTRTRALAFPGGHPQERALNIAFFVNRYGPVLSDRLIELLPLETDKHYVLRL